MPRNRSAVGALSLPAIGSPISVGAISTTIEKIDLLTGVPHFAIVPVDKTFLANPSTGYGFPFKLTRSQLCYLWFRAKEFTISGPDPGTSVLDITRVFASFPITPGPNNFAVDGQSFFYPLDYNLGIGPPYNTSFEYNGFSLFSDGSGKYFPRSEISAGTTNPVSTAGDSSFGVAGNANLKDFSGATIYSAPLFNQSFGGPSYGDVDCVVTDEW